MAQKPILDSTTMHFVAARPLAAAVKIAADRDLMTISEFIRRSLVDRLRADGIDPAAAQDSRN